MHNVDELYPNGASAEEWTTYCRTRQREWFPHDGELLRYAKVEPTTVSIGDLLKAKGVRIA